jgi:hypothetical protein
MTMAMRETKITVRVQATGGKFLGDDIGGALVTIRDGQTGEILASGVTSGDSGSVVSDYSPDASQRAIVTPGRKPTVQWLLAAETTSRLDATLALERPTLLEVSAFGAVGGLQAAHRVTTAQWVVPGQHLTSGPGFVVELPGLLLQVLEPPTHLSLPSLPATVPLKANVTMVCGCPIAPGEPWIPTDFEVFAEIRRAGTKKRARVPLAFAGQTSLFAGSHEVRQAGFYEATFTAIQQSTGNTGTGQVTFFYQAPGK